VRKLTEEFFPLSLRVICSVGIKMLVSEDVQRVMRNFRAAGIKVAVTMEGAHEQTKPLIDDLPWSNTKFQNIHDNPLNQLEAAYNTIMRGSRRQKDSTVSLAVSGEAFSHILSLTGEQRRTQEKRLQEVIRGAGFVVFSQMTTELKAKVVKLMSQRQEFSWLMGFWRFWSLYNRRTGSVLVVGDSTDDVTMMTEADLSIFIDNGDETYVSDAKSMADFVSKGGQYVESLLIIHLFRS
jgi:soluble P-type ATPase